MAEFFSKFRVDTTEEKRRQLSRRIEEVYPESVPVLLDLAFHVDSSVPPDGKTPLATNKCLAPQNLTVGQFAYMMKSKYLRPDALNETHTLCVLAKVYQGQHDRGRVLAPSTGSTLFQVHSTCASSDGFLYLLLARESTFG
jgi:hypothetical protein